MGSQSFGVPASYRPVWTEINQLQWASSGGAGGWTDKDLSGSVPAGAVAVVVSVLGAGTCGLKGKGMTSNDLFTCGATAVYKTISCDVNRFIQFYEGGSVQTYNCVGYLK